MIKKKDKEKFSGKRLFNVKKRNKFSAFHSVIFVILLVYTFLFLFLFVWGISFSLKDVELLPSKVNPTVLFDQWHFENYLYALQNFGLPLSNGADSGQVGFVQMLLNSFLYSAGCALARTVCIAIVAYCCSKYSQFALAKIVHYVVIVTLTLPIVGSLPSTLEITETLGLYDSLFGNYILKFGFNNIYYLIVYAAFKSLPWELAEAAFIDGASHFRVFTRIMLPMVTTLLGTIFLLYFIEFWNDYQGAMIFLPSMPTVSYGLYYATVINKNILGDVRYIVASSIIVAIPIFIIFMVFRKKIMGNLTEGGVKE